MPNQLLGVRLHTIAMSGLSHVRTELFQLLVIPSLAHHPKQTNRQLRHGYFSDLSSSSHRQVKVLVPPLRNTACRYLRRLHQQEAQHRAALFGDMPQSSPFALESSKGTNPVSGDLLAALKSLCRSDDQHEGQRG